MADIFELALRGWEEFILVMILAAWFAVLFGYLIDKATTISIMRSKPNDFSSQKGVATGGIMPHTGDRSRK